MFSALKQSGPTGFQGKLMFDRKETTYLCFYITYPVSSFPLPRKANEADGTAHVLNEMCFYTHLVPDVV